MGLDMYARKTRRSLATPVDFEEPGDAKELHYWRKHPNLHGWMEQLYRAKGGANDSFNVVPVQLTAEDLDALDAAIEKRALPDTSGFFFGATDGTEYADDKQFVAEARQAIAEGYAVYYTSWW